MHKILKSEWYCDYCGKHQDDVLVLIAGPDDHAICDSCTEIAMSIVIDKRKELEDKK